MAEERRKKRSHAEVVAAREQYLKEREERQKARAERKAAREAKQQARAERQAERAKLIAERQARKEQREKLRNMTEGERAQARYEQKLAKARKANKIEVHPLSRISPYQGEIEVGEWYTFRFAGAPHYGKCISHKSPGDSVEEGQVRISYEIFAFETKEPRFNKPSEFWIYPAKREDVIWRGIMTSEDFGYQNNLKFNGISYY